MMSHRLRKSMILAGALCLLVPGLPRADHPIGVFGPTAGGPVVTPTADMLPQGQWGLGIYSEYRDFENLSRAQLLARAAEEGHVHALDYLWSGSLAVSYGLREDLTLAANLPYVRRATIREAHVHGHGGAGIHELGNASGIGDTTVAAYWRFWRGAPGFSAALSLGSFVPTGEDDQLSAEGERLETEFQPGSGAWRPFVGATLSWQKDRSALHSNLRYTHATEGAQDTKLGDKVDYGLAFSYRFNAAQAHYHGPDVAPHHHHDEPALQWDGLLELTGEYTDGQTLRSETEADFEHIIYFAPGFRLSGVGGWTTALSMGVPVYEHRKEGHVETKWRALLSMSLAL